MTKILQKLIRKFGYELTSMEKENHKELDLSIILPDFSEDQRNTIGKSKKYTMTSVERMASLLNSVEYVCKNKIPGDIAECGVWRGGSMMLIAYTLMSMGDTSRDLYLYDTFEGMSEPTDIDRSVSGNLATDELKAEPQGTGIWCYASIDEVRENLHTTGYPPEKIHFLKGKVEETIPANLPNNLALLRLDTDWYESTKHELIHLYPLLHSRGILMIDDYGHWQGARKAVDEYFEEKKIITYLHRIDYTGRILVRTDFEN